MVKKLEFELENKFSIVLSYIPNNSADKAGF